MLDTAHYWQSPYIEWSTDIPDTWTLFVFYTRTARVKAKVPAVLEALSLLGPFDPLAPLSGPQADQKGVFWLAVDPQFAQPAEALFPRLGYSYAVDRVTWRGKRSDLLRVYEEDQESMRSQAPDMRTFWLQGADGEVRPVKGYRGSGSALTRRGLPVADARLLVNLVSPPHSPVSAAHAFLDPFGGIGGVVIEALASGYHVFSVDNDAALRPGLEMLGASHHVGDAAALPFDDQTFTAIAAEPPYHPSTQDMLIRAFGEMARVLVPGGRLAMLVAGHQVQHMLDTSSAYDLRLRLAAAIDRKGTDVAVLAWEKTG
jgi:SAM-dependent methyltransferase